MQTPNDSKNGDDDWVMVEDELLATAQLFTRPIHLAHYKKLFPDDERAALERTDTCHGYSEPLNQSSQLSSTSQSINRTRRKKYRATPRHSVAKLWASTATDSSSRASNFDCRAADAAAALELSINGSDRPHPLYVTPIACRVREQTRSGLTVDVGATAVWRWSRQAGELLSEGHVLRLAKFRPPSTHFTSNTRPQRIEDSHEILNWERCFGAKTGPISDVASLERWYMWKE
ncbi:uncharacterized protein J3D65DRAFT_660713 [Phyllosticta citribraziliensis]|uniref:Uncharacterized protein n=1 Tax=Phyllosticta citribraziliensis TaxID=989973 RepID=A0ABR1LGL4_9PEZI